MTRLCRLISSARNEKGLSIRALAKLADISHSEVNKIEDGRRINPSSLHLKRIADALDIDQFDILVAAGYIDEKHRPLEHLFHGTEQLTSHQIEFVQLFIDFLSYEKARRKG